MVAVLTVGLAVGRGPCSGDPEVWAGHSEKPVEEKVQAWLLQNRWDLICPALQASPPTPATASIVLASAWTDCLDRAGRLKLGLL
ncbi:hypothetical protein HRbin11_02049 [bacterium HR11]|nr:hypothetical protein HRbin11_02049 [bacterium HR11]